MLRNNIKPKAIITQPLHKKASY